MVACISAGCALGPDYMRPTVEVPHVPLAAKRRRLDTLAEVPAWWRGFGDPELDALVGGGTGGQPRSAHRHRAGGRVRCARGRHARAGPSASRLRRQRRSPARGRGAAGSYSALLSASWELDLWGRIRREDEAARANLLATEQARLGVALTLVSAVVSGYVTLLDLDRRLKIAEATVEGRKRNVDIFQMRLDGGVVSDFEMMQVTAEYESAVAAIPDLQQAIAQQEHALSVLVGRNPGPITRGRTLQKLNAPPVPAGLPSELIARRPDILQSEQQLVAANALVGAARALYFPSLSLTGSGGSASSELDDLFSGPARSWSFAGQLLGPIFAGGAIDSANRQAEARREQALAAYQQTIQNAFPRRRRFLAAIQPRRTGGLARTPRGRAAARGGTGARALRQRLCRLPRSAGHRTQPVLGGIVVEHCRGDGYRSLVDLYRALGGDWIGRSRRFRNRAASTWSQDRAARRVPAARIPLVMQATRTQMPTEPQAHPPAAARSSGAATDAPLAAPPDAPAPSPSRSAGSCR